MHKKPSAELHALVALKYRLDIVRNGVVIKEGEFQDHMITDAGLDLIASVNYAALLSACIIGTGAALAVRRDGGAITFTQSGTTITASGSFFLAADTGRLFKWGTGSAGVEGYLTFLTSTTATYSVSQTVSSASAGTVWYVNTANIVSPIASLTWAKDSTFTHTTAVTTSGAVATVTYTTVNISSALASPATITEIAIGINTTNTNVYDRDIVSPNIGMLAGDQAKVTIIQTVTYSPITPQAVSNIATGYNSAGNIQFEGFGSSLAGISSFGSNGAVNAGSGVEPSMSCTVYAISSSFSLQAFNATSSPSAIGTTTSASQQTYGTGSRFRDYNFSYSISQANGTIFGLCLSVNPGAAIRNFTLLLTSSFTKAGTQTLTGTFRKSWSRVLVN